MNELKKLYPLAAIIVIIVACSGAEEETSNESNESDSSMVDSLVMDTFNIEVHPDRPVIDVDALFAKADEQYELPFKVDSSFIGQFEGNGDEKYDLTGAEAKYLAFDMLECDPTDMASYEIRTFIELDSIKTQGDWDGYQKSLDLGMARYSNGNVVGVVKINDQVEMLLWTTDYATYEACPYGSGTYVFGTLFTNKVPTHSLLLGEMSGGGDPPAWGDTRVYSEITQDMITTKRVDRSGEEDYEGMDFVDTRKSNYEISISPQGLTVEKADDGEWSGDNY